MTGGGVGSLVADHPPGAVTPSPAPQGTALPAPATGPAAPGGAAPPVSMTALRARLPTPALLCSLRREAPCALLGAILLAGVFLLDGRVAPAGSVEGLGVLPVLAATRLLSRRLLLPLVTLGVALDTLGIAVHGASVLTTAVQACLLVVIAGVGHDAAMSSLRLSDTERRARDLAAETRRATDLERSKSDFLRLASHEVRAPLSVLLGYVGLLEEGTFGELPETVRTEVLPVLRGRVDDLVELSEAMLEAARLDHGRLELPREPVDLREVAAEAAARVDPMLGPSHRLVLDRPPLPVVVAGDALRLTSVVVNLLANAVKYSPAGGEVRCTVRAEQGLATVTVADQGIGIDAEDLPRLFTRFTRLVRGADLAIPGTGLGLYIARQLARAHGGDIVAASTRGVGSTFTVTLPLAPAAVSPPPGVAGG
jgi:signal transduction histidine kinase